jgi:subtilisin family serine protease
MRPSPKFTRSIAISLLLLSLSLILLLTGCEISRPGGEGGDVSGLTTPTAAPPPATVEPPPASVPPPTAEAPLPTVPATTAAGPATAPAAVGTAGPELPEVGPPAPQAPPIDAMEAGSVLLRLNSDASIQARSAEVGGDGIVAANIPSLDQRLREIGASDLVPILEPVAEAIPDESTDSLSAQAVEGIDQIYTVSFSPDQNPEEVADKLAQDPTVEYAEPNFLAGITAEPGWVEALSARSVPPAVGSDRPALFTPNDPLYSFQWHLPSIQMPAAWDTSTGQQVIVAVVDTGVDFRATDLASTSRLPGYDFANDDNDPTDDQAHGTHVAGTIAQSTNNGTGVAGVAFGAQILPVKVLGANGQGSYENIIKGIVYAVDQGAKVINLSLAGRAGSSALEDAMQYANSKGVVVVAAAGNSGGAVEFPAAYDEYVIGVGSVRFDSQRPTYSNFGPQVDVMAPGGDLSVDQNGDGYADGVLQQTFKTPGTFTYLFYEGTSMASPHVAGLAALLLSRSPALTPAMVENLMVQSAKPAGPSDQNGAGLIQAAAALAALGGSTGPTPTPTTPVSVPPTTAVPTATFTPTPTPSSIPIPVVETFTPTPTTGMVDEHGGELPTDTPTATVTTPVPVVSETPTPILTPVGPTLTPTPLPAGELLLGGGFESDEGWVFGDTPIRGGYDTNLKLGGNRSVRLGNVSGRDIFSFSSVWQRVSLPAEATQVILRANVYPLSQDNPGSGDVQNIMILNDRFQVIRTLSKGLSNSAAWQNLTYDLSDLKGQTVYIYFSVVNLGRTGRPTAMYVDDVSLTWAP